MFSSTGMSPQLELGGEGQDRCQGCCNVRSTSGLKAPAKSENFFFFLNSEQIPHNQVLWDGDLRCTRGLSLFRRNEVIFTIRVVILSVLIAFPFNLRYSKARPTQHKVANLRQYFQISSLPVEGIPGAEIHLGLAG